MFRYWIPVLVSFLSIACINVQVDEEFSDILPTEIPQVQDTLNEFASSQERIVMRSTPVPTPTPLSGTTILKRAVEKYDAFGPRSYSTVFSVNTQGRCRPDICREFNQEANEFEGIKQYGRGSLISENEFFGQDRFQYQGTNYFSEHRCVDGINYETDQDNDWSEVGACRNSQIESDIFSLIKNQENSGLLQLLPIGQVSQNDYKTYFHISWGTSEINTAIQELLTSLNMDTGTLDYFHIEYWIDSDNYNLNRVSVIFYDYQNDLEIGNTYLDDHLFQVTLEIKLLPFDGDVSWLQKPEIFVEEGTFECSDSERSFDAASGQWECAKKDLDPKNLLGTRKPEPTPTPKANPKQPTKYIDSDSVVYWISSAGSTGPLLSESDFTTAIVAADAGYDHDNKVEGANESNSKSAVVMSATYGDGKVVAFGHDGFLTNVVPHLGLLEGSNSASTGNTAFDNDDFLIEVINWVGRYGDLDVKIATNHNEWANWLTLAPLREILVETGYSPSRIDGVITSSELRNAGVLILGNAWGEISDDEISAIHNFVENGGGLIMAGLGWSWLSYADNPNFDTALRGKVGVKPSLDNYPMNKLAKAFGIQWGDNVIYDPYTESESIFIAHNLTGKLPKSARVKQSNAFEEDPYVPDIIVEPITRLTDNDSAEYDPSWSPDGSQIMFTSDRDGLSQIYLMNPDGTNQTNISIVNANVEADFSPSWSPDGSKIIFESVKDGFIQIYVMNVDGTNRTQLTNNFSNNQNPSWAPDDSLILFQSDGDGISEKIYVMTPDGAEQMQISQNADVTISDYDPSWSPDGKEIVYNSWRDEGVLIFTIDKKRNVKQLSAAGDYDFNPRWSPDGLKIVFTNSREGESGIAMMDSYGDNRSVILQDDTASSPHWSPDGSKVVFTSNRDGNREIYTISGP